MRVNDKLTEADLSAAPALGTSKEKEGDASKWRSVILANKVITAAEIARRGKLANEKKRLPGRLRSHPLPHHFPPLQAPPSPKIAMQRLLSQLN
jgi:hypothetical protein